VVRIRADQSAFSQAVAGEKLGASAVAHFRNSASTFPQMADAPALGRDATSVRLNFSDRVRDHAQFGCFRNVKNVENRLFAQDMKRAGRFLSSGDIPFRAAAAPFQMRVGSFEQVELFSRSALRISSDLSPPASRRFSICPQIADHQVEIDVLMSRSGPPPPRAGSRDLQRRALHAPAHPRCAGGRRKALSLSAFLPDCAHIHVFDEACVSFLGRNRRGRRSRRSSGHLGHTDVSLPPDWHTPGRIDAPW